MSYLLVFLILSLVVTLHEFGHLLAAKRVGIPIARFSVGFGPKLWGFRIGTTEYWISMIPCGGYVLPLLDEEETFEKVSFRGRIIFSLGGPVANIVGAFLLLSLMNSLQLGFSLRSAFYIPLEQVCQITVQICAVIPMVFSHPDQLSSIVGIVAAGGGHAGLNVMKLLQFSILLNLNLAVFNLLPVPPLDGGKIVMAILRALYRPLRKLEMPLTVGGWVLLLGVIAYATVLDIARVVQGTMG